MSTVDLKNGLTQLLRAAEAGELVVITRHGKPIAQLGPPPAERREVQFGALKDTIVLHPGWDDYIDEDRFLEGDV